MAFDNNPIYRFSIGGHVVLASGGPLFWKSKKQILVTLFSIKAEFVNLIPAGLIVIWIANIFKEVSYP